MLASHKIVVVTDSRLPTTEKGWQFIKAFGDVTRLEMKISGEQSEMRACMSINSNEDRCMLAPSIFDLVS